jgi:hypothetical protein
MKWSDVFSVRGPNDILRDLRSAIGIWFMARKISSTIQKQHERLHVLYAVVNFLIHVTNEDKGRIYTLDDLRKCATLDCHSLPPEEAARLAANCLTTLFPKVLVRELVVIDGDEAERYRLGIPPERARESVAIYFALEGLARFALMEREVVMRHLYDTWKDGDDLVQEVKERIQVLSKFIECPEFFRITKHAIIDEFGIEGFIGEHREVGYYVITDLKLAQEHLSYLQETLNTLYNPLGVKK